MAATDTPRDDTLRSLPVLLGPGASEVLAHAVADAGGRIESTRARFVNYKPGVRVAIRYSCRIAWPDGNTTNTTVVATERVGGPPSKSTHVEAAGTTIGVWRWPDDPRLPGLRPATDAKFVRSLLEEFGMQAGAIKLSTRAYWPGRRAVIQATIPGGKLSFNPATGRLAPAADERLVFIKIVRPRDIQRLQALHETLAGALPIARSLGWSKDLGLIAIEALPGETISGALKNDAAQPPSGDQLLELFGRLARFDLGGDPRRTTADKIRSHVTLLKAVLPEESDALDRFVDTYGTQVEQPLTTVHGDFHEEQVLVHGGRITGLLDVDDAGPGQLVDDLALMIGRVRARAHFAERGRERIAQYEQHLLESFSQAVDPNELRRRAAGALLGRATAPFRGQAKGWRRESRERLRMAENWVQRWAREPAAS